MTKPATGALDLGNVARQAAAAGWNAVAPRQRVDLGVNFQDTVRHGTRDRRRGSGHPVVSSQADKIRISPEPCTAR